MRALRSSSVVLVCVALVTSVGAGIGTAGAAPMRSRPAVAMALPDPVPCLGCWRPRVRTSWQWQLNAPPTVPRLLDVEMYDIDGFDASRRLVRRMHARDIRVTCYVDAGSWEEWRPDAEAFPQEVLGRSNGWPGERWLDIRRLDVLQPIMEARVEMCARKGFDAVEFDLVDAYMNRTGFPLTAADQLAYNVWLANTAHQHGMAVFLKNDLPQIDELLPYFDGAVNEQCHEFSECGRLSAFVDAGEPVFGVEYSLEPSGFCPAANRRNFEFLKKRLRLDAWRVPCR